MARSIAVMLASHGSDRGKVSARLGNPAGRFAFSGTTEQQRRA